MSRELTWLGDGGMKTRETHVFLEHDPTTRLISLECGLNFVEPLDQLEPFEHPFYGWWKYAYASCRECRESVQSKYTQFDVAQAHEIQAKYARRKR